MFSTAPEFSGRGILFAAEHGETAVFAVVSEVDLIQCRHIGIGDCEVERRIFFDMFAGRGFREGDKTALKDISDAELRRGDTVFSGCSGDHGVFQGFAVRYRGIGFDGEKHRQYLTYGGFFDRKQTEKDVTEMRCRINQRFLYRSRSPLPYGKQPMPSASRSKRRHG